MPVVIHRLLMSFCLIERLCFQVDGFVRGKEKEIDRSLQSVSAALDSQRGKRLYSIPQCAYMHWVEVCMQYMDIAYVYEVATRVCEQGRDDEDGIHLNSITI